MKKNSLDMFNTAEFLKNPNNSDPWLAEPQLWNPLTLKATYTKSRHKFAQTSGDDELCLKP